MSEQKTAASNERSRMLGEMPMKKLVPTVSIPIMISMLVQALYNIVDGIFVAQYSPDALTAVNLAMPMQTLMIAVATGMGTGANSLIARRLGEQRSHEARDAARHGMLIELCGWMLFILVGLFLARPYIAISKPDEAVLEMGTQYLQIVCIFSVGQFLSICFERMMQATGNTKLSMLTQLSGAVVNIILDPIMIFTFDMGIRGAAIATVIGQIFGCLLGFYLNQTRNSELRLTREGFHFSWATIKNILVVGLPSTVMQAISSVCNTTMNMLLMNFGSVYVDTLGVYFKLQSFVFMPVFGLCNGMVPIVGYNFGARMKKRVYECVRVCLTYAISIMALGVLLFLTVPHLLMLPFDSTPDQSLTAEGCIALRIICSHFLIAAAGITLSTVFQAVGKGVYSLIMSLCRQLVVLLPVAWLLSFISPNAIWWAFPIAETVSLTVCLLLFRKCNRELIAPLPDAEEKAA